MLRFVSFGILGVHPVPVWCDNEACVQVARNASAVKRLAYVARRVKFIQELESRRVVTLMNIEGNANPADMLTKYLAKPTWFPYASRLYNQDLSKIPSSAAGVQKTRGSSTPGGGVRRDTDPSGYRPLPDSRVSLY